MALNIILNKTSYSLWEFAQLQLPENLDWAHPAQKFISQWLSDTETFTFLTSGSTGTPKKIEIQRSQMIDSATATIKALDLHEETKALLCINTSFIGGAMMLVRAIVGSWQIHLIEPSISIHEVLEHHQYNFAALVPLQLKTLVDTKVKKTLLNKIDKVIIGGAPIPDATIQRLQDLTCKCYLTYGMTETVSHIALRALNYPSKSDWFELIGDNQVRVNVDNCLEINGAATLNQWITTNDVVTIEGNRFKWLGRADLVINSGGIKIPIELAEREIDNILPETLKGTIILWKRNHNDLGDELIGITNDKRTQEFINTNKETFRNQLKKYHFPKTWFLCSSFQFTKTGKIDRSSSFQELDH